MNDLTGELKDLLDYANDRLEFVREAIDNACRAISAEGTGDSGVGDADPYAPFQYRGSVDIGNFGGTAYFMEYGGAVSSVDEGVDVAEMMGGDLTFGVHLTAIADLMRIGADYLSTNRDATVETQQAFREVVAAYSERDDVNAEELAAYIKEQGYDVLPTDS